MLQISRSLTIKQMAVVSAVAVGFIFAFVVILLFHFVNQQNYYTATQMESMARSVRQPLSAAVLKADIPAAQAILQQITPAGMVGRADVVLPDQFQALHVSFSQPRPVPAVIARLFDIPQQISLPLYSPVQASDSQPLAYLVLQADSWRAYRYVLSMISTLITYWLLLSLVLSVAISWCINRLMVHPLRRIARQLDGDVNRPLPLSPGHHDDEIGLIIRGFNQYQQRSARKAAQQVVLASLPRQLTLYGATPGGEVSLLIVHCPTLNDASLPAQHKQGLLLALVEKLRDIVPAEMVLARVNEATFALASQGAYPQAALVALTGQLHQALNDLYPAHLLSARPVIHIGTASAYPQSWEVYRHTVFAARHEQAGDAPFPEFSFQLCQPCQQPGNETLYPLTTRQ